MKALILFNVGAGIEPPRGAPPRGQAIAALCRRLSLDALVRTVPGLELRAEVERAARDPAIDVVVLAGGDGTISTGASVLVESGKPLGILPLGTLNHFARDLRIPLALDAAVEIIVQGRRRSIDVGEVNGRVFVNNSSLGLYPAMVHRREKLRRRLGGGKWRAMLRAMLIVLRSHPFLEVALELDGVTHRRRTPFVFVGNNVYKMEGFTIGLREDLDRGVLSVYVTHRRRRLGLVLLALRALFGLLHQARDFEASTTRGLRIESRHRRLLVATDGEVAALETPLDYRIRPGALQVIAP
jgi:diacylglycerol kinase family enzyme